MAGIGFFAPLPIALMIPFMASQSLAMGEAFGKGFQYGKRRISAMSNEDFNKLTPRQLHMDTSADIRSMIPDMKKSMRDFSTLQPEIIKELLSYALTIADELTKFGTDVITDTATTAANFDYLKSLQDFLTGQGTANEQATLALLEKAGLAANARISQTDKATQLAAQKSIILRDKNLALAKAESERKQAILELALKNRRSNVGPTISPAQLLANEQRANQQANTLIIVNGKLINKDTRKPAKKLRPPKSIVTQRKKYKEEIRILTNIIRRYSPLQKRYPTSQNARLKLVKQLVLAMEIKYQF